MHSKLVWLLYSCCECNPNNAARVLHAAMCSMHAVNGLAATGCVGVEFQKRPNDGSMKGLAFIKVWPSAAAHMPSVRPP